MRENRTSGSEGGEAQTNELSLPLFVQRSDRLAKSGSRFHAANCSDHEGSSHVQGGTRNAGWNLERGQCNQSNSGGVSGVV